MRVLWSHLGKLASVTDSMEGKTTVRWDGNGEGVAAGSDPNGFFKVDGTRSRRHDFERMLQNVKHEAYATTLRYEGRLNARALEALGVEDRPSGWSAVTNGIDYHG